ncbi:hypothetical protein DIPPA_34906 [Diplonema papillatum]|nr:hypothetical protein DIPPA_34906 [Diplonema papillatum]
MQEASDVEVIGCGELNIVELSVILSDVEGIGCGELNMLQLSVILSDVEEGYLKRCAGTGAEKRQRLP